MNKIIPLVDVNNVAYTNRQSLTEGNVPHDLQWTYRSRSMSFDKNLNRKGQYCYHPFNTVTIDPLGDVYTCICQAWLPITIGKIWEFESFEAIMQSVTAREIQASILDGSYKYCDDNTCSILQENQLDKHIGHRRDTVNWINFALDNSCNLTCPSCREEFKFISEGPEYDRRIRIVEHLIKLIENHRYPIKFTLSGDGDPFASSIYRHLLTNLNLNNNNDTEIEIVTNGILVEDHWHKMSGIHNNIKRFKLSFDAATEDVYNIVRRGGNWNKLLSNSKYILDWKLKNNPNMKVVANFVVQDLNYKDMPAYVDICNSLGFDEINFQRIDDWGTYHQKFNDHAIWKSTHPRFANFLEYLNHPSLNDKKINFNNLINLKNDHK